MLEEIKREIISRPDVIIKILDKFGFAHIVNHNDKYISCGRDCDSSAKSIVIRLENNDYVFVKDYSRNISKDIFSYIMHEKKVEFRAVLNVTKAALGITDYYDLFENNAIFGGFYQNIRKKYTTRIKTIDESVLDNYECVGNIRFLRDNISLNAQKYFGIGYDISNQAISIPIRDQIGNLMGVKVRANYDVNIEAGEMKYYYTEPCLMSNTLYGYYQNYEYLTDGVVLIAEAEKAVLQAYTYGIRNIVSLGSGTISTQQVKMLLELAPKKIIFLHDVGYKIINIMRNIEMVQDYSRFQEVQLGYWNFFGKDYEDKVSPTDMGKEKFLYILENEIKMVGDDDEEL